MTKAADMIARLQVRTDADRLYDAIARQRKETTSDLPRINLANTIELLDDERAEAATLIAHQERRIEALEAQLAEADKHSARIEKLLLSSAEGGALKLAPEGHVIITQDELAELTAQLASAIAAGDALAGRMHHEMTCDFVRHLRQKPCSCGLTAALTNWTAAKGDLG